jgi:ribosome biogenesis protein BMS1
LNEWDAAKERQKLQYVKNDAEFEGMSLKDKARHMGYLPGMHVRIVIEGIPCEFVNHFDLHYLLILGGIQANEHKMGYIQARVKRHRWHQRNLKHNDPIIMSVGWRRFQTLPVYAMKDRNDVRTRMIKYTPENEHCIGTFWAPLCAPLTGIIGFQNVKNTQQSFRVSLTGTVLDISDNYRILKKLKLTGDAYEIHRNTAYVKGLFTSCLEAAKFVGAKVKTVSRIRGAIKKVLGDKGCVRCTFEDKVKKSDIIFLNTWVEVDPIKFYNPVLSLLYKDKTSWSGMRTVGQMRYERKIRAPFNRDSVYKPVFRKFKDKLKIHIPAKLQKALPFELKPKYLKPKTKEQRFAEYGIGIVKTQLEKETSELILQLGTFRKIRLMKENEKRIAYHKKMEKLNKPKEEDLKLREKERRKKRYREQAQMAAKTNQRVKKIKLRMRK